jgi:hypothetical protein
MPRHSRGAITNLPASQNIRVKIVSPNERDPFAVYCAFKGWFGRIDGHLSLGDGKPKIWLTYPRAFASTLYFWPLNFRLIRKIEQLLPENGARRCDWRSYVRES